MKAEIAIAAIVEECAAASKANGPFHSAHEGYAVLLEELDELWEEVRLKKCERDSRRLAKEAIQVGAMALCFLQDICADGDQP